MKENQFWEIIAQSKNDNLEIHINQIKNKLVTLDYLQIVGFERILRSKLIEADHFNIIAAQKIIEGSVSDDTYLYFRCWLILLGHKAFQNSIKNPDYLTEFIIDDIDTWGEGLLYASTDAFCQNTGKTFEEEDERFPRNVCFNEGLDYDFGAPATKGDESVMQKLQHVFPKLYSKLK